MGGFKDFLRMDEARLRMATIKQYLVDRPDTVRLNIMGWPVYYLNQFNHPDTQARQAIPAAVFMKLLIGLENSGELDDLIWNQVQQIMAADPIGSQLDKFDELNNNGWPSDFLNLKKDSQAGRARGAIDRAAARIEESLPDLERFKSQVAEQLRDDPHFSALSQEVGKPSKRYRADLVKGILGIQRRVRKQVLSGSLQVLVPQEVEGDGELPSMVVEFILDQLDHHVEVNEWTASEFIKRMGTKGAPGRDPATQIVGDLLDTVLKFFKTVVSLPKAPKWEWIAIHLNAVGCEVRRRLIDELDRKAIEKGISGTKGNFYSVLDFWMDHKSIKKLTPRTVQAEFEHRSLSPSEAIAEFLARNARAWIDLHTENARSKYRLDYAGEEEDMFQSYIRRTTGIVKEVLVTLQSFGLRRMNRVPIIFSFQSWSEPSQHGSSIKVGHGSEDHVMIFGSSAVREELVHTLSHEIGHIVYARLPAEEQQRVAELAQRLKITDYGRTDFVYDGLSEPAIQHTSGNEWFAEMIAFWTLHHGALAKRLAPPDLQGLKHGIDYPPQSPEELKNFQNVSRSMRQVFASQRPTWVMKYKKPTTGKAEPQS